ncbi:MAG: isopenicillin N synthase family oxygenase [Alphaproteobacteria bacterium]|nr:isopenicillin N synthase family oxygenase [Alphaproteobacteria bacterium]MBV8549035.1 isopenicillin N synthase family oxygenase [Alphaproteobacteria bacterium]
MTAAVAKKFDSSAITPVPLSLYDQDFDAFSQALGASFQRYGFAVLSELFTAPRLGFDKAFVDRTLAATKAFYALPAAVKEQYHQKGQGGQRGYTPFGVETAKGYDHSDLKEFWHMGRDLPSGHRFADIMKPNIWPAEVADFKPGVTGLFQSLDHLGNNVLRAIARYLHLDTEFFADPVKDGNSILRLLHYPPVEKEGPSVRAGAHGDINVITLLMGAEEPGLQLLDRDGTWLPITPPEGCIVVNIGDMLSRLTNHVLPSTIHRVVNPDPERARFARYSTPFFLHFAPDYVIKTLSTCISADNPDQYPQSITANEFLKQRLRDIGLTK